MQPNQPTDPLQVYLQRLHDDFVFFLHELWEDRGLAHYAPLTDIDDDMMRYAGHGPRKRGLLAPRGYGKTYQVTCALAAWFVFRNPDHKVLIASKSQTHAVRAMSLIRAWLDEVPFLKHLAPVPDRKKRDSALQFDVRPAGYHVFPTFNAVGIGGQLPGIRAHLTIIDDAETEDNTKTPNAREDLYNLVSEFHDITSYEDRFPGQGGEVVYVGTPHHQDSLYPKLHHDRGYEFRTYPIMVPDDDQIPLMLGLAPYVHNLTSSQAPGTPLFPERFPKSKIVERQAEGPTRFLMQSMLIAEVGAVAQYPLRLEDLIVSTEDLTPFNVPMRTVWGETDHANFSTIIDDIPIVGWRHDKLRRAAFKDPNRIPLKGNIMRIDPSGMGKDETAYAVAGCAAGTVYTLAVGGLAREENGASPEVMAKLASIARDHNVREIRIEKEFGGEAFAQLLGQYCRELRIEPGDEDFPEYPDGWNCLIETVSAGRNQKETRILAALESVMAQHRLVISRDAIKPTDQLPRAYELQWQIAALTRDRDCLEHDDRVEVLAAVCADWLEHLNLSPEEHSRRADQRRRDERIAELVKKYRGQPDGNTVLSHRSGGSTPIPRM